ncbi:MULTISPECIES: DNA-binding protein [unclassified Duganella]|uniref:HVO_A0114 family putative DNA-binding protein n=1 Tax=unclassified Duganella TaxID=2636909 RepID=UPI0011C0FEEA|nr:MULTISPECIES: DNA-binding protein [unclassified Duganella]
MKTVTLEILSSQEAMADLVKQCESGSPATTARIIFTSQELLRNVLTPVRWEILKTLCGSSHISVADIAMRLGRPESSVQADIDALILAGVIDRAKNGGVIFPYDEVILDLPTAGRATV